MIIGFLGKGGSGKSSVSTQMCFFLNEAGNQVLAIDADHNIDLSYNLSEGSIPEMNYVANSLKDLQESVGLEDGKKYSETFLSAVEKRFALNPLSPEIERYSKLLPNSIRLMAAGPQTDTVLYGKACSHILTTPLKILLPLLELSEKEIVVIDEKAGADGVTTGVITGVDVGVIVCEPAIHSIKAAKQIAELMEFYETPYLFVGNKVTSSEDKDFIKEELGQEPTAYLMSSNQIRRNPSDLVSEWQDELEDVYNQALKINKDNRLERTTKKFERNKNFN